MVMIEACGLWWWMVVDVVWYLTQLTHLDHILWVCNWEYVVLLMKMEFLKLFKPSIKYSIIPLDLGSCRPAFWPASSWCVSVNEYLWNFSFLSLPPDPAAPRRWTLGLSSPRTVAQNPRLWKNFRIGILGNFCHIYHRSDCHDCLRRGTYWGGGIEETNSCTTWPSELFKRSKNQDQQDQTSWDCLTRRSAHFWDARLVRIWTTTNFQCVLPRNEQPLVDRFSQSWTIFVQMSFGHYHQYLQDSTVACRG